MTKGRIAVLSPLATANEFVRPAHVSQPPNGISMIGSAVLIQYRRCDRRRDGQRAISKTALAQRRAGKKDWNRRDTATFRAILATFSLRMHRNYHYNL